jgi:predicted nucleic acid-binding Zn ribbon protein
MKMNRSPISRELTRHERHDIRKLVIRECANYDYEYGCLPLDSACYMLNKWWTGLYCKYFQRAVLPLNAPLEASLTGAYGSAHEKTCPVCGAAYYPVTSQAYCSEACRIIARRKANRGDQKNRRKKGGHLLST